MFEFNTIEEVVQDLREGRIIIMTDDPERENEGDLICAAEFATKYNVNFMATYAKGLICMPMSAAMSKSSDCLRWWKTTRTIMHPLLLSPSIMWTPRRYFGCGTFLYRGQVCG